MGQPQGEVVVASGPDQRRKPAGSCHDFVVPSVWFAHAAKVTLISFCAFVSKARPVGYVVSISQNRDQAWGSQQKQLGCGLALWMWSLSVGTHTVCHVTLVKTTAQITCYWYILSTKCPPPYVGEAKTFFYICPSTKQCQ